MKKIFLLSFLISTLIIIGYANAQYNPVGYWSFDDCSAKDSSGYDNNGVIYGANCTAGKIGNALNFDGLNDYVDLGNSNSLNTTSFTILFWLNLTSDPNCDENNNWRSLIRKGYTGGTNTGCDVILDENRCLWFDIGNGTS